MEASFTVPAYIMDDVREGATGELNRAAESLKQIGEVPGNLEHPACYQEYLSQFDEARALLDRIGWPNATAPREVIVDLVRHGLTLLASLRGVCAKALDARRDVLAGEIEDPLERQTIHERAEVLTEAVGALEAAMAAAGIPIEPAVLKVPHEIAEPIRDGLHRRLCWAAEGIANVAELPGRERHPEWYANDKENLTDVERLLNVLGWGPGYPPGEVEVDLRRHGWALSRALEVALIVAEDEREAVDRTDAEGGTSSKLAAIADRLVRLREFASSVRGQVGAI